MKTDGTASATRIAALWFPDWPLQAVKGRLPQAIVRGHSIWVCDAAARHAGIRRDMPFRQAKALCPQLSIASYEPDRDYRAFEPIVASLDQVTASVEVLRPGLVAVNVASAARYYGGEDRAAELLIDAASSPGVEVFLGIADEISTAVLAARVGAVVPPGMSAQFLSGVSLNVLLGETALRVDRELIRICERLGLRTLGDIARLPRHRVVTRFGKAGQWLYDLACGQTRGSLSPRAQRADYSVSYVPEEPLRRVDAAAFVARSLAAELHEKLRDAGLVCHRLKILAVTSGGVVERVWHLRDSLDEKATAQRVRWQLDGWLSSGAAGEITELTLIPVETATPSGDSELWKQSGTRERVERVVARVQSMVGSDEVVQPAMVGGRGVAERIAFVPYGESRRDNTTVWAGQIPAPLPNRLAPCDTTVQLLGTQGKAVSLSAEVLLSQAPYEMRYGENRYRVSGWAGPWPVSTAKQHCARMELVGLDAEGTPQAWLIVWADGRWHLEASYG